MAGRILLADEQKLVMDGLKELFQRYSDYKIVATVDNGEEMVEKTKKLKPDVAIMDIFLKKLSGIEAARRILREVENIKIITLTMHCGRQIVIEAFRAGIHGYLLKTCSRKELFKAVATVRSNKTYLTPEVMDVVVGNFLNQIHQEPNKPSELSDREREILQRYSEGNTTKQIAFHLHISAKTVATHRERIYKKLNLSGIADLTKFSIRKGLITL